jgi:cold shock CspA family protein
MVPLVPWYPNDRVPSEPWVTRTYVYWHRGRAGGRHIAGVMAARSARNLERTNSEQRARARSRDTPISRMPALTEDTNEHVGAEAFDRSRRDEKRCIFLDLENLAFLGGSLQPLQMRCRVNGVEFRAYTSPDHDWASRATHIASSNEKEAADVRMVLDASRLLHDQRAPVAALLMITDDQFGATLAAEEPAVTHVTYSSPIPMAWRSIFRGSNRDVHETLEAFFASHEVFRARVQRGRSESVTSGATNRSRSASRTRASWSRQLNSDDASSGFSDVGPYRKNSKRSTREAEHLKLKLDAQRNEIESLRLELDAMRAQTGYGRQLPNAIPEVAGGAPASKSRNRKHRRRRRPGRRWPAGVLPSPGKVIGTFKWFDQERGYGFLTYETVHGPFDVFVHRGAIMSDGEPDRTLEKWDVEFKVIPDPRKGDGKFKAEDVTGPNGRLIPVKPDQAYSSAK